MSLKISSEIPDVVVEGTLHWRQFYYLLGNEMKEKSYR
jgi:hypothetical protein